MSNATQTIETYGLVPVIKLESADTAEPLAVALRDAGLPLAEVTFRTAAAADAIRRIGEAVPEVLLGAGTVLTVEQVKQAVGAGASFIVTPGFNPRVVEYCVRNGITITPGVNDPSAVEAALEYGLTVLKFFPAEASGGTAMLKALAGPYGNVRFIPTGGVSTANLEQYLTLKNVAAVGGSWMVPSDRIAAGDFERVGQLTSDAVRLVREIRG